MVFNKQNSSKIKLKLIIEKEIKEKNLMIDNFNIMFNEVYSVLNLLGREYIYKLPNNVYEFIKMKGFQIMSLI